VPRRHVTTACNIIPNNPNYEADSEQGIPFWMDTLCCPVGKKHKNLRLDTIRKMENIYRRADRVLVLDDGIQKCPLSAPVVEKTALIYMSNWLRRLWTLQEGILAKDLYFQYKGGPDSVYAFDQLYQDSKFADAKVLEATYKASTNFLTLNDPFPSSDLEVLENSKDEDSTDSWETEDSQPSN
jgi:hypothetical protein